MVQSHFEEADKICEGISNLLGEWHNKFYRFGLFDKSEILKCVIHQHKNLIYFRNLNICDVILDTQFESKVKPIFDGFLDATAGKNPKFTRRTVTGTSKSLSLLAPKLFPMCDEAISQAYDCWWVYSDFGFIEYTTFMHYIKILAEQLIAEYSKNHKIQDSHKAENLLVDEIKSYSGDKFQYNKSLLKIIDEYNYAKHTKEWC